MFVLGAVGGGLEIICFYVLLDLVRKNMCISVFENYPCGSSIFFHFSGKSG